MFEDIFTYETKRPEKGSLVGRKYMYDSIGKPFYVGDRLGSQGDPNPDIECLKIENGFATFQFTGIPNKGAGKWTQDQQHITDHTVWVVYKFKNGKWSPK